MLKTEIVQEICAIVPLDFKRAEYGLMQLRKDQLEKLLRRLRQKERSVNQSYDYRHLAVLEKKHDLCERCGHQQHTPYGMRWCNAKRPLINSKALARNPNVQPTFKAHTNPAHDEGICVTVSCDRFLPNLKKVRQSTLSRIRKNPQ